MRLNPNALPEYQPQPVDKRKWVNLVWIGILLLVVFSCIFMIVIVTNGAKIGCMLTNCRYNPSGPAVSWAEQYEAAQEAARKADPDAVLDGVHAEPVADWPRDWTISNTLELSFRYLVPSGNQYVEWQDSSPESTIRTWAYTDPEVDDSDRERYEKASEKSAERERVVGEMQVSPREAEIATWQEAIDEAKRDGVDIEPWIYLDFESVSAGARPTWEIFYSAIPTNDPPGLFGNLGIIFNYSSKFSVDATTGEIVERDMGKELNITPALPVP
ncbi:MAG: hypothetical protein WCD37_03550 [Chloroflexia bacterium]